MLTSLACSVARFMDLSTVCGFLDEKLSMDVYGCFLREQPGHDTVMDFLREQPGHDTVYNSTLYSCVIYVMVYLYTLHKAS